MKNFVILQLRSFISGYFSSHNLTLSVDDAKGKHQDWDLYIRDNGSKYKLTGNAYSYIRDKNFSINVSGK